MKRIFTCILLLSFCLTIKAQTEHTWVRTNPGGGGAFDQVMAGPTGIILAGSDLSGAYISKDKGETFTPIGAAQGLKEPHIGAIGFDPSDENKFYIGTTTGLYRTTDKGVSFTKVMATGYVSDIVVSKSNPLLIFVAWHQNYSTVDGTIYRSIDGGLTFSALSGNTGTRMLKLILDPKNELILYYVSGKARSASSPARLYRSSDGGITFADITGGNGEVMDAAIDPVTTTTIYMTISATFPGGSYYKSIDSGTTWSAPAARTGALFVKQDEPNRVRMIDPRATSSWNAASGTWESIDRGVTWSKTGIVTSGWETAYNHDVATTQYWDVFRCYNGDGFEGIVRGFGTDMSDPNVILWCGSQFLFRSTDGGVTFNNIFTKEVSPGFWQSRGIDNVNMSSMAISEVNSKTMYVGYYDMGFWRSIDGGNSWQSSNDLPYSGWEGYGGNVESIAADPTREGVVWTTMSANQMGQTPTYLLKNTQYGQRGQWTLSNTGLPTIEILGLSIDRSSSSTNRTMYVTAQGFLYKSINDGANWTQLTNGLPTTGGLRFTAVDNFNGNIVYAGGGNGLYASTDGGINWAQISNDEINSGGSIAYWNQTKGQGVFDIAPDPQTTGVVYITVYGSGKGLFRGDKGTGATWTWTKLCTDSYMRKVCINPLNNNYIYATSSSAIVDGYYNTGSHGVLFSSNKFATYTQVNGNMAWPFAMTVKIDKSNNVFVGSPGTGFQKSKIPLMVGIEDFEKLTNEGKIFIYPNPTKDIINISNLPTNKGKYKIEIRNMLGQKVLTVSKLLTPINVSALINGEYIISIIGPTIHNSLKFIKK